MSFQNNIQDFESFPGFEDKSGQDLHLTSFIESKLFELFRLFGYEQIGVPILEKRDFFTSKYVGDSPWPTWNEKSLFEVDILDYSEDYSKIEKMEKGVLVPEGTVSICRWLCNRITRTGADIDKILPLQLYYRAKCFRNEPISSLSQARKREFLQIGLELFGTTKGMADIEVLYLMMRGVEMFGIPRDRITVRIGDVRIFNQLIKLCNIGRSGEAVLKDKLDELAASKVLRDEKRIAQIQNEIETYLGRLGTPGLCLDLWRILYSSDISSLEEGVSIITRYFENEDVATYFRQMGEMLNFTRIPFKIDFCTIRGQEYYTGPVFEMDIRSGNSIYPKIAGGGRYDQLISKFLQTDSISVPAIGFAYGLERLLNVLSHEGMGECGSSAKYFLDGKRMDYVIFPKNLRKAWKAAEEMRGRWNRVGLYYLDNDIARAKKYAEREGAVFLEI